MELENILQLLQGTADFRGADFTLRQGGQDFDKVLFPKIFENNKKTLPFRPLAKIFN